MTGVQTCALPICKISAFFFSGGEKKKAEILQLLMLKPSLALLDETDSGLDVDAVKTVASGIKAYHNADNALIIITHKLHEVLDALGRTSGAYLYSTDNKTDTSL